MVAGQIRKWQGQLLGHDVEKLRRELEESRDYIFEKAGVEHDLFA
jgi:5-methylthioadenosine/S-adenosylhomocysteine deaminase